MQITAAVLRAGDGPFVIERLELDEPRPDEVLVRMVASGMCHTDVLSRELPPEFFMGPQVYGHEGSGVVEAVGSAVTDVAVGDHVVDRSAAGSRPVPGRSSTPSTCSPARRSSSRVPVRSD